MAGLNTAVAQNVKPAIIFSGDSQEQHIVALEKYNRVSFGTQSMTLSHSDDPSAQLELPYSSFNRFSIGEGEPTASIADIVTSTPTRGTLINYDSASGSLRSGSSEPLIVNVFSLSGQCLMSVTLTEGESVSVATLPKGIYLAKATNKSTITNTNTIKFIKQ